jgi:hypothetical protein
MNYLILMFAVSLHSAVLPDDWTPRVAAEGAIVTLEWEIPPAPLPTPKPDGARKGTRVESPLDTYREAKALIDKGNTLADRGKAILDQAERDGKITVDIRLPEPLVNDSRPKRKPCSGGICPLCVDTEKPSPSNTEPTPTCDRGDRKSRRFLRWRR